MTAVLFYIFSRSHLKISAASDHQASVCGSFWSRVLVFVNNGIES